MTGWQAFATTDQKAFNFDGVNDYVNLGTSLPHVDGIANYTLEAWIKPVGVKDGAIISRHEAGEAGEFMLSIDIDNKIKFSREVAPYTITSPNAVSPNTWVHVAASYDGQAMHLFIDGVEVASLAATGGSGRNPGDVLIGASLKFVKLHSPPIPINFFEGTIDNVRFWNVALTSAELVAIKDKEVPVDSTGLVSVWDFNKTSGVTLSDSAGSTNGTIINSDDSGWVEGVNIELIPDVSVNCFQQNGHLTPGEDFQQILGLKVAISKQGGATLSEVTFDLSGTTNLTDIKSAHVYTTGRNNTFYKSVATEILGSGSTPTANSITFNGTHQGKYGLNYYWLVLDLESTAVVGDSLDASCTSFTLAGNLQTITNASPVGVAKVESATPKIVIYNLSSRMVNLKDADLAETMAEVTDSLLIGMIDPNADGTLKFVDTDWAANLARIKAQKGSSAVRLHVGLAGHRSGPFAAMASSVETRNLFVTNLVKFVTDHGLDGVDIDWEYPDNATEWANYSQLCLQLKEALFPTNGWLCSAGAKYSPHTNEVLSHMDFFNLMTYDYGGYHSTYSGMVNDVQWYVANRDIPMFKLIPGLPSYTNEIVNRVWANQRGYITIIEAYPNLPPYVDSIDVVNGFTSGDAFYNHGFNGVTTIQKKCEWIINNNCGGAMLFRLMTDMPISHHKSVLRATRQVINEATLNFSKTPLNESYGNAKTVDLTFTFSESVTAQSGKYGFFLILSGK